jgi:hypothetical protein
MNYNNEDDQEIKKLFRLIKEEDLRVTPSFDKQWDIASTKITKRIPKPSFLKTAAVCTVLLMFGIVAFILWKERTTKSPQYESISEWRAPTDFLLKTPGEEWLKILPKLDGSLEQKNRRKQ